MGTGLNEHTDKFRILQYSSELRNITKEKRNIELELIFNNFFMKFLILNYALIPSIGHRHIVKYGYNYAITDTR